MTQSAVTADDVPAWKLRLLLDTCVWLDLAKDYRQRATLTAIEELIKADVLVLLVPEQVIQEFGRNKDKIIRDGGRSLSSHIRRAKEAVSELGSETSKQAALRELSDVDHKINVLSEASNDLVVKIEKLLENGEKLRTTDATLLAAAQRAIDKVAPFHKSKNSMADAVIIELYADALANDPDRFDDYAFVTHNKHDFSDPSGDDRTPHPDLAEYFDNDESVYSTNLISIINEVAPDWLEQLNAELADLDDPRLLSELLQAERELERKIWYSRHMLRKQQIDEGSIVVLPEQEYSRNPYKPGEILDTIWAGALDSAKRVEEEIGIENLVDRI